MTSSKYTPELAAAIISALENNPSLLSAATGAGIGLSTLSRWLKLGHDGDPLYAQFSADAAAAMSSLKDEVVAALRVTATDLNHPQQTRAAHQLLSSLYPLEFANVQHTVQHKEAEPAGDEYDLSLLETDELRFFLKILDKLERLNTDKTGVPKLSDTVLDVISKKNGSGK